MKIGTASAVQNLAVSPSSVQSQATTRWVTHRNAPCSPSKKSRKVIEAQPDSSAALTLSSLVVALETEFPFLLSELYMLDHDAFGLALEVMIEWRLDR
jgi:hypothetical protein